MPDWKTDFARLGALLVATALAVPAAAAADVFAWRTEDGVYAYTDDRGKIPARYRAAAVAVRDSRLGGYERLTREDTAATRALATRLEKRLDYLRQVNAEAAPRASATAASDARTTISVATGSAQAPTLDVATDPGAGPIVVEPIITKQSGDSRTRRATLVKQGDRTIAVLKGRRHHYNVNEDIHDEDDLADGGR